MTRLESNRESWVELKDEYEAYMKDDNKYYLAVVETKNLPGAKS
jgi:hypothetical protein